MEKTIASLAQQAAKELGINVPILSAEKKDDGLVLHLYGGQTVTWSPKPKAESPAAPKGADADQAAEAKPPATGKKIRNSKSAIRNSQ